MRQTVDKPAFAFKDIFAWSVVSFYRGLERRLSHQSFHGFARAVMWSRAFLNNIFKKARPVPMPDFLRTQKPFAMRVRQRSEIYLDDVLLNFPDRLASPKWQANCQITGLEHLRAARENKRPVVLGFFHFGSFPVFHCWLRSLGYPIVGLVGGRASMRTRLALQQDRRLPFPEIPLAIYPKQLRELAELFHAGNPIYIAIDAPTGKQLDVPFCEGWDIRMATGALRFASRHEADLLPCAITSEGNWRYQITIGRPVPRELLADENHAVQACKHLVDELMPVFKARPEQCWDAMACRFRPKSAGPAGKT
jgi:hypothetical protein